MTTPTIGSALPSFTAATTQGELASTSLAGKPCILYFYPRDNTPGCTTEAQDFRDEYAEFQALGCAVFGISRDTLKSHENFITKQALPFPLIADPDEQLCLMFDVMKDKNMYGKKVRGIERSTFLFDQNGILVQEWRRVKVPGHVDEVLQAVRNLGA